MARFERQGWAEVVDVESGQGPERKRYRITESGVAIIDDWVMEPQSPGTFSVSTLFARVSVALLSGRDATEVLVRQRANHLERMRVLTRARGEADAATTLALTYEIAHLDADLRWIEESGQRLDAAGNALKADK
ncbi:PadR family transcriptional regulator [Ornithinimicrobium sp. INDO-MA30-4]|uniref:PadR family transcriptional regulator n=1 Tax=Ornithinimicrobium sp. INDO-MA30-4 TaxID=2908651 RepID=UPI001F237109|nr:PadR family transcriptional regulator [Ornithinimicrobium sp. INDO-MA30-4]UJH70353.1 PadR family transcriptional regulator [Ornithinimicrobium sp. INDO-MA30-4]